MAYLELFGGIIYLLMAGDLLVRGAVALARKAKIPPMIVGLTIVAFGTSAPELFVAISAVLQGFPGIAIGNVVGSNIANVLLVIGVPAIIYPTVCNQSTVRRDGSLMLATSLLFVVLCTLGPLGFLQGAVLFALLVVYLLISARDARGASLPVEDEFEMERALGLPSRKRMIVLFLVLGAVGLPLGANLTINGAVEIARAAGVSNAVIGLTLVALGTSLPELATTLVAAIGRHSDVALGNILGSNVFNILAIMGLTAMAAPEPIHIPPEFIRFDLPIMLGVALVLAWFTWTKRSIGRRWGLLFVSGYALYIVALF